MNKKYLITIDGAQIQNGEKDSVSFSTVGRFCRKNENFFITYEESAATGFEGDTTTLSVESGKKVTLRRRGISNTQLIIELGQRHLSHYNTEYGDLMIGIRGEQIKNNLDDHGGDLSLSYSLDVNANALSVNKIDITVKEI